MLMWRPKATNEIQNQIALLVQQAQQGDDQARNNLISSLSNWAVGVARGACGRPIDETSDEYSVSLLAINEAIDSFHDDKGAVFTTFAEIVIKRRLLDLMRKNMRVREFPRSSLSVTANGEEYEDIPAEVTAAEQKYLDSVLAVDRRIEIESLSRELMLFGLTFADLPAHTPKHNDARDTALGLAQLLVAEGSLWEECRHRKLLPVSALCERSTFSRKTIERHRKYIIAVALILGGDYPLLRRYLGVK